LRISIGCAARFLHKRAEELHKFLCHTRCVKLSLPPPFEVVCARRGVALGAFFVFVRSRRLCGRIRKKGRAR